MGTDNGDINLVIFDADDSYQYRRAEILQKTLIHEVELQLFLYPNNSDSGDREALLCQLTNSDKYQPFSDCFAPYADCLQAYKDWYDADKTGKKEKLNLFTPRSKWTLKSYFALHRYGEDESKIDYTNPEFWIIDSPAGNPLRDFLAPYFS